MSKLALIEISDDSAPRAYSEIGAARYLGISRPIFRERLLMAGIIPWVCHAGGRKRMFLKSDLDAYLNSLEKRTMASRENPLYALKGGSR